MPLLRISGTVILGKEGSMPRIAFLLLIIGLCGDALAAKTNSIGIVTKIRMFSNPDKYDPSVRGFAFIYLDQLPGACGSAERRVAISTDHPLYSSVLSIAVVSKTTGSPINLWYLDQCTLRGNAWDFSYIELL